MDLAGMLLEIIPTLFLLKYSFYHILYLNILPE
jgi:hypothetical protein